MTQSSENLHKNSNTKSVSKTLAILSTFDENTPRQRTSDIASKLGLNISTVSRHLNTLLDWGYLQRDDVTGDYYPGLAIVALAGATLQRHDVYRHSYPELLQLSNKFGVYSHMGVPRDTDIIHLICCPADGSMEQLIPMGHSHPMYCSAMGRAILPYMPAAKVLDILKRSNLQKYTEHTKVEIQDILKELDVVKQQGYCRLFNELTVGKGSFSAPIFDRNRNPVAAISISASTHRLSQPDIAPELIKAVITSALKISGKLGYFPK